MEQEPSKVRKKEQEKALAMPTILVGAPEDKQRVTLCMHAVGVVAGTERVTTSAGARDEGKDTRRKVKTRTQERAKMIAAEQRKVVGSARDSTEPGGVASPGHPRMRPATKRIIWMED